MSLDVLSFVAARAESPATSSTASASHSPEASRPSLN
jgi:hypothetical protein